MPTKLLPDGFEDLFESLSANEKPKPKGKNKAKPKKPEAYCYSYTCTKSKYWRKVLPVKAVSTDGLFCDKCGEAVMWVSPDKINKRVDNKK